MKIIHAFDMYAFDESKLQDFGFNKYNEFYYKKELVLDGFYFIIQLDYQSKIIDINAYDSDNQEYELFNVSYTKNALANILQQKKDELIKGLINQCCIRNSLKDDVLHYIYEKYSVEADFPWKENTYAVLRCKNHKWFGLIMEIKYKNLGISSNERLDVINIKLPSDLIESLIDNKTFFKAYHMNKKYWISIILNNSVSLDLLKSLIDKSYSLVNEK